MPTYRGIGNLFREWSQAQLMTRLRDQYDIRSVLNAPYDHATDPEVDNEMFGRWDAWEILHPSIAPLGVYYDLVWNFDFVQRYPVLLEDMILMSNKYVLAFVPNRYNGGQFMHGIYHRLHGSTCTHPEGGNPQLMTKQGLVALFESVGLHVLEVDGVDLAPWPDYTVPIGKFFATPNNDVPISIYEGTPRIPIPKQLLSFERLIKPLGWTWAHHLYCLGEKQ